MLFKQKRKEHENSKNTGLVLSVLATITFSACSTHDNNIPTTTGVLADGAVGNARYECGTINDFTTVKGEFTCPTGLPIDFYYGNIKLGGVSTLPADRIVLVQDILGIDRENVTDPLVTRLAVFLQSLDNDADHSNGIFLDPALIEGIVPTEVDFKDFDDAKITEIFNAAQQINGVLVKVSDTDAQANLQVTTDNVKEFQNIDGEVNDTDDVSLTALTRAELDTLIAAYSIDPSGSDAFGTYESQLINANTSLITDMKELFLHKSSFNLDISNWDTSAVTDMNSMFAAARAFNQDISSWNTSAVTDMFGMFQEADAFNQDISSWDTSAVTDMSFMFQEASAFANHDLSSWNVGNVTSHLFFFDFTGSGNTEPNWVP